MTRHDTINPTARDDVLRATSIRVPNAGIGFTDHAGKGSGASSGSASERQYPCRSTGSAAIVSCRPIGPHVRQPQTP